MSQGSEPHPVSQPQSEITPEGTARPLNLWIVNQYAAKFPGPGLTRHHFLADAMRAHRITTTIITDSPERRGSEDRSPHVDDVDGTRFVWLRTRAYRGNGISRVINMFDFVRAVLSWGWRRPAPDVILGSSPQLFAALAGWILAKRHRIPFVLEIRDLWPESFVAILGMSRHHPLVIVLGWVERLLYRRSDRIVGVLDGIGDYVKMRVGRRAAPVTWIPNGVPLDRLPAPTPLREPGDEFVIVYAGSHGPPNGLDVLLRAAEILQKSDDPADHRIRLDLYGSGASKAELVAQADRARLANVHFHDPVSRTRIFEVFVAADAVIALLPHIYLWRFGISPNKLYDYFAAERPVILAIDAPNDPVTVARAGIKTTSKSPEDLADAMRRMAATSMTDRRDMAARGRRYVSENNDMTVLGRRLANVLRDATNGRR